MSHIKRFHSSSEVGCLRNILKALGQNKPNQTKISQRHEIPKVTPCTQEREVKFCFRRVPPNFPSFCFLVYTLEVFTTQAFSISPSNFLLLLFPVGSFWSFCCLPQRWAPDVWSRKTGKVRWNKHFVLVFKWKGLCGQSHHNSLLCLGFRGSSTKAEFHLSFLCAQSMSYLFFLGPI